MYKEIKLLPYIFSKGALTNGLDYIIDVYHFKIHSNECNFTV